MKKLTLILGLVMVTFLLVTAACAKAPTPAPAPSPTAVKTGEIKGLISVGVIPSTYNDDRDAEKDGVKLYIAFFDAQEKPIAFKDIPIKIGIELYTTQFTPSGEKRGRLVYDRQVKADHTEPPSVPPGNRVLVRIPFEDIKVDPEIDSKIGTVEIAVTTPSQGVFQARSPMVMLYDLAPGAAPSPTPAPIPVPPPISTPPTPPAPAPAPAPAPIPTPKPAEVQILEHHLVREDYPPPANFTMTFIRGKVKNTGTVTLASLDVSIWVEYQVEELEGRVFKMPGSIDLEPATFKPGEVRDFEVLVQNGAKEGYNISVSIMSP